VDLLSDRSAFRLHLHLPFIFRRRLNSRCTRKALMSRVGFFLLPRSVFPGRRRHKPCTTQFCGMETRTSPPSSCDIPSHGTSTCKHLHFACPSHVPTHPTLALGKLHSHRVECPSTQAAPYTNIPSTFHPTRSPVHNPCLLRTHIKKQAFFHVPMACFRKGKRNPR
jgi:hypothetical protein